MATLVAGPVTVSRHSRMRRRWSGRADWGSRCTHRWRRTRAAAAKMGWAVARAAPRLGLVSSSSFARCDATAMCSSVVRRARVAVILTDDVDHLLRGKKRLNPKVWRDAVLHADAQIGLAGFREQYPDQVGSATRGALSHERSRARRHGHDRGVVRETMNVRRA